MSHDSCAAGVCSGGGAGYPLAEQIINNLLGRQDTNYVVRMYCIRGLGNMASINDTQVRGRVCVCVGGEGVCVGKGRCVWVCVWGCGGGAGNLVRISMIINTL